MRTRHLILVPVAVAAAALPAAANAKSYAVVLEIKADETGTITDVTVASVIDWQSGSTTPVKGVKVSDAYLKAARDEIMAKEGGKGKPGFTYRYMNTKMPDQVLRSPL